MKYVTVATEKRINQMKKREPHSWNRNLKQGLAVYIWDKIFADCGYFGGTLKELNDYLGEYPLENAMQIKIPKWFEDDGIYGIEYSTNGNVRYVGTHDLHYVNIDDFNKFVKQAAESNK